MTLAGGRFKVYVAFGSGPFDPSPSWTDITGYVRSVQTSRGRSSQLDQFQAGTGQILLDNRTRLFDPENAAGTHYGDIKPGVPVKVEFDDLALSDVPVFYGFATAWQQLMVPTDGVCNLQVIDGFGFLNRHQKVDPWVIAVEAAMTAHSVTGYRYAALDDSQGTRLDYNLLPSGPTFSSVWSAPTQAKGAVIGTGPGWAGMSVDDGMWGDQDFGSSAPQQLILVDLTGVLDQFTDGQLVPLTEMWNSTVRIYLFFGQDCTSFCLRVINAASRIGRLEFHGGTVLASTGTWYSPAFDYSKPFYAGMAAQYDGTPWWAFYVNGAELSATSGSSVPGASDRSHHMIGRSKRYGRGYGVLSRNVAWAVANRAASAALVADLYAALWAWDGDYTGQRVDRILDAIGWPAALRDLDTGQTLLGPQGLIDEAPLNVLRRIEASEQGWLFIGADGSVVFRDRTWTQIGAAGATSQATFSDDGAGVGYLASGFTAQWDWTQIRNQITVTSPTVGQADHTAQTSVDTYGPASESVETVLKTFVEAENLAAYRADQFGQPTLRIEPFRIRPEVDPAGLYPTLLALELADRVTVERTPQGQGAPITIDCLIQGIAWSITPGDATVTFQTSPAGINTYATWDAGEWDNDSWGY